MDGWTSFAAAGPVQGDGLAEPRAGARVRDERGGVGCALMDAAGSGILVIGADLHIAGRFEPAVSHVVFLQTLIYNNVKTKTSNRI